MEIDEPAFYEPTIEFLSTFTICSKKEKELVYKFRLFHVEKRVNLMELNVAFGFMSAEFVKFEEYKQALNDYPDDFHPDDFWLAIVNVTFYKPNLSKSSALTAPAFRFIQKQLAYSLFARSQAHSAVPRPDLLVLWCMIRKRKLNLGFWFAKHLLTGGDKQNSGYRCGSFITRLAMNLNLYDPSKHMLSRRLSMVKFTVNLIKKLKIKEIVVQEKTVQPKEPHSESVQQPDKGQQRVGKGKEIVIWRPIEKLFVNPLPAHTSTASTPAHTASTSKAAGNVVEDELRIKNAELEKLVAELRAQLESKTAQPGKQATQQDQNPLPDVARDSPASPF